MTLDKLTKHAGLGTFLVRLVAGLIMLLAGFSKVSGIDGFVGMLSGMGLPAAAALAWIVAIIELLGGLALILGLWVRWSALLLGIIMLVATVVMFGNGFDAARLPLILLAAMIMFLTGDAGRWALGSKKGKK